MPNDCTAAGILIRVNGSDAVIGCIGLLYIPVVQLGGSNHHGFIPRPIVYLSAQYNVSGIQATQTYFDSQRSRTTMEVLALWCG